jgi:hypothetical protein
LGEIKVEMMIDNNTKIKIRRQWNDWRIAKVNFSKISGLHWDNLSGGVAACAPQFFIHGFVLCDSYDGDLAHSCMHGRGPHSIKVCITKMDNKHVFEELKLIVGEKPHYASKRRRKAVLET